MCDDCWTVITIGRDGRDEIGTCRDSDLPCPCDCHTVPAAA